MKKPLFAFAFIFYVLNLNGQLSIETNVFSLVNIMPSVGIKVESNKYIFGVANVFDVYSPMLKVPFYENTHKYKIHSNKINPFFEFGYYVHSRIALNIGYGYVNHQRDETKCLNPSEFLRGIVECEEIIHKVYDAKLHYYRFTPAWTIIKSESRMVLKFVVKTSFTRFVNNNHEWDNLNVNKISDLTNRKFIYRDKSFLILPNIELNVGYKI